MKKVYLVILLLALYGSFFPLVEMFQREGSSVGVILGLRVCLLTVCIFLISMLFYRYVVKRSTLKDRIRNILLFGFTFVIIFLFCEIIFCFVPRSHSFFFPMASKIWLYRYSNPINEMGFRDESVIVDKNKKTIVFIGDSFTAGNGIEYVKDRYSDLVRAALKDCNVLNVGVSGLSTRDEIGVLKNLKVKPDAIVWQYFYNDFEGIGPKDQQSEIFLTPMADLGGSPVL